MESETVERDEMNDAFSALRQELSRLSERVAALEAAVRIAPREPVLSDGPPVAKRLSEDVILVISAAIAAFLGKKPHIRQIRLLGDASWAQQGRVLIQASHNLPVRHG